MFGFLGMVIKMYKGDLIEVKKTITSDEMRSFNKDPDLLVKATIQDINNDIIKELTKYIDLSQSYQPNNDLIITGSFNLLNDFETIERINKQLEYNLDTLEKRNNHLEQTVNVFHAEIQSHAKIIDGLKDKEKILIDELAELKYRQRCYTLRA